MGFAGEFSYRSPADIFREHAALSGFENGGTRAFDISGLASLSDEGYEHLAPVQWPARGDEASGERRFFANGGFFTADRKAHFVAPEHPGLKTAITNEFPYRLNTGRIRDQWHTMTRTGRSPRLALHSPEPFVEIHPEDAANAGVTGGGFARVSTQHGSCVLKVSVSDSQRKGSLFAPIHWSAETSSCARIGDLVAPHTDPYSGQPESKATPAAVAPVAFAFRGFVLSRRPIALPESTWWARAAVAGGWGYLLATNSGLAAWRACASPSVRRGHGVRRVRGCAQGNLPCGRACRWAS